MAEHEDKSSKTEQPTEKKLSTAIEKGQTALSREVMTFTSLLAMLAVLGLGVTGFAAGMESWLAGLLDQAGTISLSDHDDARRFLGEVMVTAGAAVVPLMAALAAGSILGSLAQNLPQANLERLVPKAERLSPAANARRIFGLSSLVELGKSLVKLAVVGAILFYVGRQQAADMAVTAMGDPGAIPGLMLHEALRLLWPLALVAMVLAVGDMAWTRFKWRKDLMMSRHEVKEEYKQAEGDPEVKGRIKMLARQRLAKRMMAAVPRATMVVVNPTHYAVALRYVPEESAAPVVLAQGVASLALRIRGLAEAHDLPVIENKPLARALFDQAEVGQMIPAEFYQAVAEIILYLQARGRYAELAAR